MIIGENKGYNVVNAKNIIKLLITYKPIFERMVDSFTEIWLKIYQ